MKSKTKLKPMKEDMMTEPVQCFCYKPIIDKGKAARRSSFS